MADELKLYRTWSSAYGLRVVWALKLKGVEFDTIFEDLANKSPLLLQYNPVHKKIPVLLHNGKPVCESLVILEYIDETWKESYLLLPKDPFQKAEARFWTKFNEEKLLPSIKKASLGHGKEREEARVLIPENLKHVEELLEGKEFFGGEEIGYLDLVFGWMAYLINVLEEVAGTTLINKEKYPLLSKWMENFYEVPEFKESWPDRDKLITKFQNYVWSSVKALQFEPNIFSSASSLIEGNPKGRQKSQNPQSR
ncbi:Glutathione transferase [Heracleum sosnowskyi]|uniref:Probable glutathione S-transferase n=1 Tax=Heracleum sosnowskyi TaxID=360622 RepID=A0AAD8IWN4_9APIA|nr:Glutathione transferase [Heracleum sosnowskyi]